MFLFHSAVWEVIKYRRKWAKFSMPRRVTVVINFTLSDLLLVPNVKVPEQQRFILHHISCSLPQEHVVQVERKITLGQHWPRWAPVCRFLEPRIACCLQTKTPLLFFLCSSSSNKFSELTVARMYAPRERLQVRHSFIFRTSKVAAVELTASLLPTFECRSIRVLTESCDRI
jgi:hypothetical protein